jgi:hypothetical protein
MGKTVTLICNQAKVHSGTKQYPLYVAFCSAEDLAMLAAAPSFAPNTPNDALASQAAKPPIRDWQRPLDAPRVAAMAQTFSQAGELMPNPVLVSENPNATNKPRIKPYVLGSGNSTPFWQVDIDAPKSGQQHPLWILDGQHRIAALAKSAKQKASPVPVVLLLDDGMNVYGPATFAKIFAQVTTEAQKLDKLHAEWLTYAFKLGDYAPEKPTHADATKAMTTVIDLCKTPKFGADDNPFLSRIQFNSDQSQLPHMTPRGFERDCITFRQLVEQNYFLKNAIVKHLQPAEVAEELANAYISLRAIVPHSPPSVFFGPPASQQTIVQDAFFIGVLSYLLACGRPSSNGTTWDAILNQLGFGTANWDFDWVETLNGQIGTRSTKIVRSTMEEAFSIVQIPGNSTLPDHLRGNAAEVTLRASFLTAKGRPGNSKASPALDFTFAGGAKTTFLTGGRTHIRVLKSTSNIGGLEIIDKASGGLQTQYPKLAKSGLTLDPSVMTNPLNLLFRMFHYGNALSTAEIAIKW